MNPIDVSARIVAVTVLVLGLSFDRPAAAQPSRIAVGAAAGSPGGVSIAVSHRASGTSTPTAVHVLASFDLDDYFLGQAHRVSLFDLSGSPVTLFGGPGIAVGIDDRRIMTGVGVVAGLRFFRSRYEVFIQAQPRVMATPDLTFQSGGAVGFRIHT